MTELADDTAERGPDAPRRNRRPVPALVFLLVLALAAMGVWWNVLGDERAREQAEEAVCSSASNVPTELDPATVSIRVYNATDTPGLAGEVTTTLESRGFVVTETANDPSTAEVTGVGELRFGAPGREAADFLRLYLPGSTNRIDTRSTGLVDLVIGPDFAGLASEEQVAAALLAAASAEAEC
ncbi:LytR C-terminal domain-containing protein [Modestobacter sp. VKM Ac-2983]|uniref:LytR C-terminal domain-containing protein n=1 Tax=Modestobacter sp. VKM Ac-2983 TaxID=3004137 RepID=UPI0022AB7A34|nr:LytR C-terminal domain-containing protein [Modestobacter sp. VKM Ac-2983]MCZ2805050.1 LytR C-terminal domain-containing protein [Modestobacter sp. VKM Ac-2983]